MYKKNFLQGFGIDLHFHPGGLWRRQLCLLFSYLLLKTLKIDIRKCGAVVECKIVSLKDRGSHPGNAAFETFQLCRRSATFLKACKKSSIFIVKLSSGMPKTFSDTSLNWSCVTRCRCRTNSSNFFTVSLLNCCMNRNEQSNLVRSEMYSVYRIPAALSENQKATLKSTVPLCLYLTGNINASLHFRSSGQITISDVNSLK
jgi:hypothetical protein